MKLPLSLAFRCSMRCRTNASFPIDANSLYKSDEKYGADQNVSRNTATAELNVHADEINAIDVLHDYSIDAPIQED